MLHRRSRRYRRHLDRPPYNPTHLQWRQVLESGVPFVKVELLRDNPMGVDTGLVMDWLETHTAYPVEFIHNNVARTRLRRRAA
jgi:hypothetical protein